MKSLDVGPMLGESLSVALRHWALCLLTVFVLGVALLTNTVMISRCVLSPGCLPNILFMTVAPNLDEVIWGANRVANWLICGFAIYRVLTSEATRQTKPDAPRPVKRRGFGRCSLYLSSITAASYATEVVYRFFAPILYSDESGVFWVALALYNAAHVCIWAYLGARFALYIADLACDGRAVSFSASWQKMRGNRRKVFLLLFVIEVTTYLARSAVPESGYLSMDLMLIIADLERFTGMPRGSLVHRLPGTLEFAAYAGVSNILCAGAFFAVYRKYAAESPEGQAKVFD